MACAHVGISFGIVHCMHLVHKLTTSYTTQSIATFFYSVVIKSNNFRITRLRAYFSPPNCLQLCVIIPLIGRRSHCATGSIVLINPKKINQPRSSTPVYQLSCKHTHARTHERTHARTHALTYARTLPRANTHTYAPGVHCS